jgi:hypothetical protein
MPSTGARSLLAAATDFTPNDRQSTLSMMLLAAPRVTSRYRTLLVRWLQPVSVNLFPSA